MKLWIEKKISWNYSFKRCGSDHLTRFWYGAGQPKKPCHCCFGKVALYWQFPGALSPLQTDLVSLSSTLNYVNGVKELSEMVVMEKQNSRGAELQWSTAIWVKNMKIFEPSKTTFPTQLPFLSKQTWHISESSRGAFHFFSPTKNAIHSRKTIWKKTFTVNCNKKTSNATLKLKWSFDGKRTTANKQGMRIRQGDTSNQLANIHDSRRLRVSLMIRSKFNASVTNCLPCG